MNRHQGGFTIVEFLIAGFLGLLVLVAVGRLFVDSNTTFRTQRQLASVQDSGRFALWFLKEDLQRGAYQPGPQFTSRAGIAVGGVCGVEGCSADGADNDTVAVRYEMAGATDCAGSAVATGRIVNVYSVVNRQLVCTGNGGAGPQPLVDNVEAFQVLYGIKLPTSARGSPEPDRYMTATEVTDANIAQQIVSVKVALLLAAPESSATPDTEQQFDLWGVDKEFDDDVLRRVFYLTVAMPNAGPVLPEPALL